MEEKFRTAVKVGNFIPLQAMVVLKATATVSAMQIQGAYRDQEARKNNKPVADNEKTDIKYGDLEIVGYSSATKSVQLNHKVILQDGRNVQKLSLSGEGHSLQDRITQLIGSASDTPEEKEQKRIAYNNATREGTEYDIVDYFITPEFNIIGMFE